MADKSTYRTHFNKFCKHIAHDMLKGIFNQTYRWHVIKIVTSIANGTIKVYQGSEYRGTYSFEDLGNELHDYNDNSIEKYLTNIKGIYTMSQESNGNNATIKQEDQKMTDSNKLVNNAVSTIKTVGAQIQASAATSAKMEAGEAILLALRNLVMKQAGFMQKVKFKFAPVLLDVAVTVGADVLVAEIMPNKKSAKLAVECLNLAMTKEVIHMIPLQEFTEALTGGSALKRVSSLISED